MGLDIIIRGADFSGVAIDFVPPVTRGLRAWHMLGESEARSLKNRYGSGAGDAVKVGAPVFQPSSPLYAALKSDTNYLQTPVQETGSLTLFLAVRNKDTLAAAATRPMLGGWQMGGTGSGMGLYLSATSGLPQATLALLAFYNVGGTPTSAITTISLADGSIWHLIVAVVEEGVGRRLYNRTTGQSATAADANARLLNTAGAGLRIGATQRTEFGGMHDQAFAAAFNVALTVAEIDAVTATVRSALATRGVTV